jgi:glycosyltransferase involved in cell wall biosynthesis
VPALIRVAYTTLAPFISGAERSLQITLRHLPAAGVEPVVVGPPEAKLAPWCAEHGIAFIACPLPLRDKWHALRWWGGVRRLRGLLCEHRVDLVHANQIWCYPATGAAGRALGLPRVCHLRDEADPATLHWFCSPGVEAVVCISRHIQRQAEAAWPAGPGRPWITTLVNPVVLPPSAATAPAAVPPRPVVAATAVSPTPAAPNAWAAIPEPIDLPRLPELHERLWLNGNARLTFGVPGHTTVFGFIGQIREVKGLLGLLDALAALPARYPWHLLVAGRDPRPGAPYEKLCRERAGRPDLAGQVTFLGFLDDTDAFYQAIDVAVVPSLEEPLGRIPLEAAAFAKPSIAFDVGGLPDTIVDGQTGWLVPAQDWTALGAALAAFLELPGTQVGRNARTWVERVADPTGYAHRLAALYHRLTGRDWSPPPLLTHSVPCAHS